MHPTDAHSPKWRIEQGTIDVVYTHPSTDWSVATMTYDEVPGCVGIRWNGDINNPADLGYPRAVHMMERPRLLAIDEARAATNTSSGVAEVLASMRERMRDEP